ncbi:MAG: hypothetical protein KDC18_11390, partial [Alphaproteobacteria bacterium]|nr:hypothetical protein [Alphaproteobacteria bacterium]
MSSKKLPFRRQLLAGTAFVAIAAVLPASAAFAVASVDLDFGSGVVQSQDFGSVLSQSNASAVTGTVIGSTATLDLLDNTTADVTYSGAYSVIDNAITATGTGNLSASTLNLAFTPTLGTDTAATGSLQTNSGTVRATANGTNNFTVNLLNSDVGFENVLTGSLAITNNDVASTATANEAGASIALASGVNLTGTGAAATVAMDETLISQDSATDADLLVSSAQRTTGLTRSESGSSAVSAFLESLSGATVTLTNSDLTSTATGNSLTGDITSTDGTASISASAAVTSLQDLAANVEAVAAGDTIQVEAGNLLPGGNTADDGGTVANSSITVTDNTISAAGTGNASTQSIDLTANQILGSGTAAITDSDVTAATGPDVQLSIAGAEQAVASVQTVADGVTVSGAVSDSSKIKVDIYDTGGTTANSQVLLTSNTIESAATGSRAVNSLALTAGSTVSAPGAVTAVQSLDGDVGINGDLSYFVLRTYEDTNGSTLVNAGNTIRATAIGGSTTNDIAVTTDILSLDTTPGGVTILADATTGDQEIAQTSAGFALVNDQSIGGTLTAPTASQVTSVVTVSQIVTDYFSLNSANAISSTAHTGGYVDASGNLVQPGNSVSSSVIGNTADNGIALSFTDLQGDATANGEVVAVTANSQVIQGDALLSARYDGQSSVPVATNVSGFVTDSTLDTSYNTVAVSAIGNRTTANTVTVSATNAVLANGIDASASVNTTNGDVTASAAFVAASSQEFQNSTIQALQLNTGGTTSNKVETIVAGTTTNSSLAADKNTLSATATANSASNGVSVGTDATSTIQASSAVANYQVVDAGTIKAVLGVLGTGTGLNNGGVNVTASGAISGSQVDVTGNTVVGEVKANTATNTLAVTGNTLTSSVTGSQPEHFVGSTVNPAGADNALVNVQSVDAATDLTSDVAASFAIIEPADQSVSGSSLAVSGNLQQSYATANTATNTVTLDATTSGMGSALVNHQALAGPTTADGTGVVTTSDLDVTANAGLTASDLTLDGNRNQSVATGNLETSTLTVAATNADAVPGTGYGAYAEYGSSVYGDSVLSSEQAVTGAPTVSASATTNVFNADNADASARIVDQSTVSLGGNQTTAQATGNSSSLDGNFGTGTTASHDANGVVYGDQDVLSGAAFSATTAAAVGFALTSDDTYAGATVSASTVAVDGNSSAALARANVGTITLDVTAANSTVDSGVDANLDSTALVGEAGFLAYRNQSTANSTSVSADSSATTYSLAATQTTAATSTDAAASNSTLSLSNNASAATAVANTSTTALRVGGDAMSTLDASAAALTTQYAGGTVSATGGVSATAAFAVGAGADAVAGSSLSLDGNTSSASASGNVATAGLSADATNVTAGAGTAGTINALNDTVAATFGLVTYQGNGAAITATNTANTFSLGATGTTLDGVDSSTLSLASNAVTAYGTGNTAANTVALGSASTASLDASAGLHNRQDNGGAVNVSAAGTFALNADTGATGSALNASTASLTGNSVLALARGNLASNSLAINAAATTTGTGAATYTGSTGALSAAFGLLNEQSNTAAVNATSTGASYTVALNGTSGTGIGANASTAALSGNSVTSAAYGNIAT